MSWSSSGGAGEMWTHGAGAHVPLIFSWSPDGAHITASNATNNKGFVFIAAVIARNSWTSEISLVGHENSVEVAVSFLFSNSLHNRLAQYPMATLPTVL